MDQPETVEQKKAETESQPELKIEHQLEQLTQCEPNLIEDNDSINTEKGNESIAVDQEIKNSYNSQQQHNQIIVPLQQIDNKPEIKTKIEPLPSPVQNQTKESTHSNASANIQQNKDNRCTIHPNNELNFYCEECNIILCNKCIEINHCDHLNKEIKDLNLKIELNELSNDITQAINELQKTIDTSLTKYNGKILPYCMEIDLITNTIKRRLQANSEARIKKTTEKYDQLIQVSNLLSNELKSNIFHGNSIFQNIKGFTSNIQTKIDEIDAKRCFNFENTIEKDFNMNEFIPPSKTKSFAFCLPAKNVITQHTINLYYCDWIVTFFKNDKSVYYVLKMDIHEGATLPKDFRCNISFHMLHQHSIDIKKKITFTGYLDQLCFLYFMEYSPDLVGQLVQLNVTLQPKNYISLAALHHIEFLPPAANVPDLKKIKNSNWTQHGKI